MFSLIQKASLIPVPVIIEENEEDMNRNFFDGELEQFLATSKALETTAIFVQENSFEEEDFLYSPDEDEQDEESEDSEIDLAALSPALSKYKKYIGQNYSFCLVAKGGVGDLRLIVDQDWVKDFENEWERAVGKVVIKKFKARNN